MTLATTTIADFPGSGAVHYLVSARGERPGIASGEPHWTSMLIERNLIRVADTITLTPIVATRYLSAAEQKIFAKALAMAVKIYDPATGIFL